MNGGPGLRPIRRYLHLAIHVGPAFHLTIIAVAWALVTWISWGRAGSPDIDIGSDWCTALFALQGRLPYRDFFYEYPPLGWLLQSALFRISNLGFWSTQVIPVASCLTGAVGLYALGVGIRQRLAGLAAGLCVPLVVYTHPGLCNPQLPQELAWALTPWFFTALARFHASGRAHWALVCGSLLGLAWLSKAEFGPMLAMALVIVAVTRYVQTSASERSPTRMLLCLGAAFLGLAAVLTPVLAPLVAELGFVQCRMFMFPMELAGSYRAVGIPWYQIHLELFQPLLERPHLATLHLFPWVVAYGWLAVVLGAVFHRGARIWLRHPLNLALVSFLMVWSVRSVFFPHLLAAAPWAAFLVMVLAHQFLPQRWRRLITAAVIGLMLFQGSVNIRWLLGRSTPIHGFFGSAYAADSDAVLYRELRAIVDASRQSGDDGRNIHMISPSGGWYYLLNISSASRYPFRWNGQMELDPWRRTRGEPEALLAGEPTLVILRPTLHALPRPFLEIRAYLLDGVALDFDGMAPVWRATLERLKNRYTVVQELAAEGGGGFVLRLKPPT